jgi:hypothetical protein
MLTDSTSGLEIVIWRPYLPPHEIVFTASDGSLEYVREGAQRAIFRWRTREDVWAWIREDALRQRLQEQLVRGFDPFKPPVDRSISKLGEVVAELKAIINENNTRWSVSTQAHPDYEETANVNSVIALYNQLRWIYNIFQDVPGACLSVR